MNKRLIASQVATLIAAMSVASCGGGGGGGGGGASGGGGQAGIGGTGATGGSSGAISGFGSIFVNGVEFETSSANIFIDGEPATEADLRLGMVVRIDGTFDDNGTSGDANEVRFDDDVQGQISAIVENADGTAKTLTVLGVQVVADAVDTIFDDTSYSALLVGDFIEVSGFFDSNGVLFATRIEDKGSFVAGVSEIELKGQVAFLNTSASSFAIGSGTTFNVDYSSADLSDVSGGTLSNGMQVEVKGSLSGNTITATRIEEEDDLFGGNVDKVEVEGLVTNFVSSSDFKVAGQQVNASSATLSPAGLVLGNDIKVEVEGPLQGGVINAVKVEARGGDIEIHSNVSSVDNANGTITMLFAGKIETIAFEVNNQTRLDDKTGAVENLSLGDIGGGDFLEVRLIQNGPDLLALEVRREDQDDTILQAPVDSFVGDVSVTLLGVTYSTAGAQFEDLAEVPISGTAFYDALDVGELIKIKDEDLADGVADAVEFED